MIDDNGKKIPKVLLFTQQYARRMMAKLPKLSRAFDLC